MELSLTVSLGASNLPTKYGLFNDVLPKVVVASRSLYEIKPVQHFSPSTRWLSQKSKGTVIVASFFSQPWRQQTTLSCGRHKKLFPVKKIIENLCLKCAAFHVPRGNGKISAISEAIKVFQLIRPATCIGGKKTVEVSNVLTLKRNVEFTAHVFECWLKSTQRRLFLFNPSAPWNLMGWLFRWI